MRTSKFAVQWEKIFSTCNVVNEVKTKGKFLITADEIKRITSCEPRLMAKYDHWNNLPDVFKDNDLGILPISRGEYAISNFDIFHKFEPFRKLKPKIVDVPNYIETFSCTSINEAMSLNYAFDSGILADFLEDERLLPTVNSRLGSGKFNFDISGQNITVNNSQIEIDSSYEGVNYYSIFEAKTDLSDDFLVRQLYYPYRTFKDSISKKTKTVFFVFSNGTFRLCEYEFVNPNDYSSIKLAKQGLYEIKTGISIKDLENIAYHIKIVDEPEVPFPQADKMERIVNLLELLYINPLSPEDITDNYDFDKRQTNYYTGAGMYLGLIKKEVDTKEIKYSLTKLGKRILKETPTQGYLTISNALQWRLQYGRAIELNNTVKGVKNYGWK